MNLNLFLVFIVLSVFVEYGLSVFQCPDFCECRSTVIIQCKGDGVSTKTLEELFKNLPSDVIYFKLTNTNMTTLETRLFSRTFMKLTQLNLEKNQLTTVPTNLSGVFPLLKTLKLEDNKIATIKSSDFLGLKELAQLYLNNNKLTTVESNVFASNAKLDRIFLQSNEIEALSENAFDGLRVLKNLRLDSNKIKNLRKGVFKGLSKAYLSLAGNSLEQIEAGLFMPNQSFLFVDFGRNMITEIDEMAFAKISINALILANNKLESFPINVFASSTVVSLEGNPLMCDCHMAKVVEYLQLENRLNKVVGGCFSPDSVKGMQLKDVKVDTVRTDFGCTVCHFNNTCLNGGKCVAVSKTALECTCPSAYEGDNCETRIPLPSPVPKADDSAEEDDSTTYIIVAVIVLVVLVVLVGVTCYCLKGRKKTQTNQDQTDGGDATLLKPQNTDSEKQSDETA